MLILLITFLAWPKYVPYFSGKDYIPEPIDYSLIDEFIKNQNDPDDPLGLTFLMPFERFGREDIRRKFHIVWNTTRFPLYGGSVIDPLHRKKNVDKGRGKWT